MAFLYLFVLRACFDFREREREREITNSSVKLEQFFRGGEAYISAEKGISIAILLNPSCVSKSRPKLIFIRESVMAARVNIQRGEGEGCWIFFAGRWRSIIFRLEWMYSA